MRTALISAIAACVDDRFQKKARTFLQGLSRDELQYIAEYLGACVLESVDRAARSRAELAGGIAQFDQMRTARVACLDDHEHKMILLLEYLSCCNLSYCSLAARAGRV